MIDEEANSYKSSLTYLIDDEIYGRFDKRKSALSYELYLGKNKKAQIRENALQDMITRIKQEDPGLNLKDLALQNKVYVNQIAMDLISQI